MRKSLIKYKNYWKCFLHEDDGSQLIEWAIIIAIIAGLIVIAFGIYTIVTHKMNSAKDLLDSIDTPNDIGGGNGNINELPPT